MGNTGPNIKPVGYEWDQTGLWNATFDSSWHAEAMQ